MNKNDTIRWATHVVSTALVAALLVGSFARIAGAQSVQVAQLENDGIGNTFGYFVAVSGDIIVVSNPYGGGARTYGRDVGGTGSWGVIGTLPPPPGFNVSFGKGIDVDGELLAVGAPTDDEVAQDAGAVYLYRRDTDADIGWTLIKKLLPEADGNQRYGHVIAIDGDRIAISAQSPFFTMAAVPVYIHSRDVGGADNWGIEIRVPPEDTSMRDKYGDDLELQGDTLVVGDARIRRAEIFYANHGGPGNWGFVTSVSSNISEDFFASSIFLHGDMLVGAGDDRTRVFGRNEGGPDNWGEITILMSPDTDPLSRTSVGMSGEMVFAHSRDGNGAAADTGVIHSFAQTQTGGGGSMWTPIEKIYSDNPIAPAGFGYALGVDGATLIAGAPFTNSGVAISGVAYIFELELTFCDLLVEPLPGFDTVFIGNLATRILTVENVGDKDCDVSAVSLSASTEFRIAAGAPVFPTSIAPSDSLMLQVIYEPTREGSQNASLNIVSNDPGEPVITHAITGSALDPGCALGVADLPINVANVPVGETLFQTLALSNTGLETCTVTALSIAGDEGFTFTAPGLPFDIAPSAQPVSLSVGFSASAPGSNAATFDIVSNDRSDPQLSLAMAGSAVDRCTLSADPSPVDFGPTGIGIPIAQRVTVTLDINSLSMLDCTITAIHTMDNPPFSVTANPSPLTLSGGQSASFDMEFVAASLGDVFGTVVLNTDDPQRPAEPFALVGSGSTDTDSDTIPDLMDNCITSENESQLDTDEDGFGNRCDADFNNDCAVNTIDLGIFRTLFLQPGTVADLNGNGVVNVVDLGLFRQLFFELPGPSAFANCP